jgi:hypothetical protein
MLVRILVIIIILWLVTVDTGRQLDSAELILIHILIMSILILSMINLNILIAVIYVWLVLGDNTVVGHLHLRGGIF